LSVQKTPERKCVQYYYKYVSTVSNTDFWLLCWCVVVGTIYVCLLVRCMCVFVGKVYMCACVRVGVGVFVGKVYVCMCVWEWLCLPELCV